MPMSPLLMLLLTALLAPSATAAPEIRVGSKQFTESVILGEIATQMIRHSGAPVVHRAGLGGTRTHWSALLGDQIDIYPEYTGNGAFFHGLENEPAWKEAGQAFELVKRLDAEKHQLVWLDRAPANNTWLIAVRGDVARRERLTTMEDFARAAGRPGTLKLAASAEFVESPAALPAFERVYGFRFPREALVVLPGGDTAVTIRSAAQGVSGVNSAMVYGTDGAIAALDLVVMQDPKGAQIVYEPAPVVRAAVLERHPGIGPALARVFATLTMTKLQSLNAQIAVEGRPARDVAKQYLEQEGLLR